jgi:peptidoglycan/LPS O-acetylase OafA/YrhL
VVGVALVTAPIFRLLSYVSTHGYNAVPVRFFPPHSFFNYFDSLTVGCTAGVMLATNASFLKRLEGQKVFWATGATAFVLVPYALQKLQVAGKLNVPLGPTLQAVGLAVLIMLSIASPRTAVFRVLNVAPVRCLGVLSYSLYIWQGLFCTRASAFGVAPKSYLTFPFWILAALAAAVASYYGFERPLLGLRRKFRHVRYGDESLT